MVVVLFFKCIAALFNPVNRSREAIKWGLVSYTVVMFSFVTVLAGMGLNIEAVSYVDDRKFPGVEDVLPPGPLGYQWFIYSKPLTLVPNFMFLLNNWLADGLLVRSLFDITLTHRVPDIGSSPALSLLCCLLHEPLGYRLPMPHVPRIVWYASELSVFPQRHSKLTELA